MKHKMLALIGAFTIILGATANAVEPFGFGIKLAGVNNMLMGIDKAKVIDNSEVCMYNLSGSAVLYGEYAIHENVGGALEAGYYMGRTATIKAKSPSKEVYKIDLHGIKLLPMIKVYPMGREDENGILNLFVGGSLTMPLGGKGQKDEATAIDIKKDDLTTIGMGVMGGVGYEFPFGLLLDLRASYAFTDLFKETGYKKDVLKFNNPKDEKTNLFNYGLTVGYNFAVLMEE